MSHGVSIANLPLELKWKPWLISSFMKPIYVFLIYLITLFKKRKDLFEKLWHRRVTDYDLGLDWNRQKGGNRNVGDYFEKAMVWLAVLYSMVLIVSWLFQPNMPFKATGRLPIYMNANNWGMFIREGNYLVSKWKIFSRNWTFVEQSTIFVEIYSNCFFSNNLRTSVIPSLVP